MDCEEARRELSDKGYTDEQIDEMIEVFHDRCEKASDDPQHIAGHNYQFVGELKLIDELSGIYKIGQYRAWRIKFPYSVDKKYLFLGSESDARRLSEEIKIALDYPYPASVEEVFL